jgi:hypothetical protein
MADPPWYICGGTPEGDKGVGRAPISPDELSVPWLVNGCGGLSMDCHPHPHPQTASFVSSDKRSEQA